MERFLVKLKVMLEELWSALRQFSLLLAQRVGAIVNRSRNYIRAHRRLRIALIAGSLPVVGLIVLFAVVLASTPDKEALRAIRNPIASEVYTSDSVLIGRYFIQDRTHVKFEDISPLVIEALISTEDVRFYEHDGIDYRSFGRVLVKTILLGDESAGGGSTITQQLAKNLFPRKDFWIASMLMNKLREIVIAKRMENVYSKKDILTLYLNTIPFGDNTFGIQAASQRYFSKNAKDLSLDQAAVLIGMLKATHYYNPRLFPKNSLARRNVVLAQMKKYNRIPAEVKDSIQQLPLTLDYKNVVYNYEVAPYFREYLKTELGAWCERNRKSDGSKYNLYADGLKIFTTIDSRLQAYAEEAVAKQMSEIQDVFFKHWGDEKPWGENEGIILDAARRTNRYKKLKSEGLSEDAIMKELSKPALTRLFDWNGAREATVSPIDSIKHHIQYLNAGFLAMESSTGKVKAWVGGIDHNFFQYDHVKATTKRQVGSIFKPIVYAVALEEGVSPCELIPAGQETYVDDEGDLWTPRNTQYDYQVKYSMRGALAYSVNTVAVKLINVAGIENTIKLARDMGIHSDIPDVPSIALG
ncbi:MAG TPA: transglycosylase domain-containing protein, partial [Chryseosolibacter sp.]|nr:transglycosylase domain-containing protein [Chryseosolibacter sp.]